MSRCVLADYSELAIASSESVELYSSSADIDSPLWTAAQVSQWAADRSPAAMMLESERAAAGTSIDRDDPKQCAQASLKQQVLADLAMHERDRAAAASLEVYYRIVGLGRQRQMLVEAMAVIDQLTSMAVEAESLGLSDEDPGDLRRQRLEAEDQLQQLDGGVEKLRLRLSQLTGRTIEASRRSILLSPLLMGDSIPLDEEAVAVAIAQRSDLRALHTLSQRLNAYTLPAVRDLLAAQQPGLGMVTQIARRLALPCLGGPDISGQDISLRRRQCHQLSEARAEQIEVDVRDALVDLSTARRRAHLAGQRAELADASAQKLRASIELGRAPAGSDLLIKLEKLAAQGDQVQRQTDEAVGWVKLRQAQGIASQSMPVQ
tara:strand:- start:690311 stop:691438 length:1128 start_codon:yes stop_codon:yes gene_type:complete